MNSSKQSAAPARKSKGRQKVKMMKMENHSNLQVTFSKRRAGLFKKASELCTLCGAEAAIVVFSPANKAYCFGHPNVQTVVDRLAAAAAPTNPRSQLMMEAHRNSNIRDLNIELTRVESLLRAERRRAEEIEVLRKAGQQQRWLPTSLEDLDYAQLSALKESVMGFKKNVDAKVHKEMFRVANPLPLPNSESDHHHQNYPSTVLAFDNVVSFDYPKLSLGFGTDQNVNGGSEAADYMKGNNYNYGWDMFNMNNVVGGSNGVSSSSGDQGHAAGFFHMF